MQSDSPILANCWLRCVKKIARLHHVFYSLVNNGRQTMQVPIAELPAWSIRQLEVTVRVSLLLGKSHMGLC